MDQNHTTIPELSDTAKNFKHGIYKHFKGGTYKTMCIARNSENRDEELIVYQSLEKGYIWVRPLAMFLEDVDRNGYKGPRFTFIQ
jgi:hypothetical protein